MKLFFFHGTDSNDSTTSLDWFVVAETFDAAKQLWTNQIEEFLGRPLEADDLEQVRILIDNASSLPIAAGGERVIDWEELQIVFGNIF